MSWTQIPGELGDSLVQAAVAMVKTLGVPVENAVASVVELKGVTPNSNDEATIIRRVTDRIQFSTRLTPQLLDDITISGDPIDGGWVDRVTDWPHHDALREYWDTETHLPEQAKTDIDEISKHLLRQSQNPGGTESYIWRGLVVGNIQSGKTATFTNLIARAFDAGYWTVIVLSGRLESLRTQTSNRLVKEIVKTSHELDERGVKTQTEFYDTTHVRGPYYDACAEIVRNNRTLWVMKKNHEVLSKMNDFWVQVHMDYPELVNRPVLIVDDESDEAGVDIGQAPEDEDEIGDTTQEHSQVHLELRRLISSPTNGVIRRCQTDPAAEQGNENEWKCPGFRKRMYIGFTATPYACCFQALNEADQEVGEGLDLYPHDCLVVLPNPAGYCGGEVFVGRHDVVVEPEDGRDGFRLQSFDSPGNLLHVIPEMDPCEKCKEDVQHHPGNRHFCPDSSTPVPNSVCNCDCHAQDEIHSVRAPFRDDRQNFFPRLVPSFSQAVDRFILSGAARAARGDTHRPVTMMVLVSNWSIQHDRLRELVETRIEEIKDGYGHFGNHRARLGAIWENEYRPTIRLFDEGLRIEGAGADNKSPDREFRPRKPGNDRPFDEIETFIRPFLRQVRHITLNADSDDRLAFGRQQSSVGLKAVVYGGFNLGRGLTLEGLVTSYFARVPSDQSVAMQLQRYCGYRDDPGERILDLVRVFMPTSLSDGYSEMLAVEAANRFRLGEYKREKVRPSEVGPRLQGAPGWKLVSAAKRGRMVAEMNPLAGKEKSQTTFALSTAECTEIEANVQVLRGLVTEWNQSKALGKPEEGVFLFRAIPVTDVLRLLECWNVAPHKRGGFPKKRIIKYIKKASDGFDELTDWSVILPSRQHPTPVETSYVSRVGANGDVEYSAYDPDQTLSIADGIDLCPWTRNLQSDDRIGTLTDPKWREIAWGPSVQRSPKQGVLIIVPVIHPYNRVDPGVEVLPQRMLRPDSAGHGCQWPIIPAISMIFPPGSAITQSDFVHEQFS